MQKQTAQTATKPNIYQIVTDRILPACKKASFRGRSHGRRLPTQVATYHATFEPADPTARERHAALVHTLLRALSAHLKQAQELGGTVRKAEKGTAIVFYKQLHGRKAGSATRRR